MTKLAIGIDIGGTMTKLGLVDLERFQTLDISVIPTEKTHAESFVNGLVLEIGALQEKARELHSGIPGIGIGVSGFVFSDGTVDTTYGFQTFMEDFPLEEIIHKQTGLSCRVDNDARLVALGEALCGAGMGSPRVLCLTLGTGLGVGFVNKGKLDEDLPFAHMAGHMKIRDEGLMCYCGKVGCLESLVSASGLMAIANELHWFEQNPDYPKSVQSLFEAAQAGDTSAVTIIDDFIDSLKIGLANFVNICAPDKIVLGGGVSKSLTPYLPQLNQLTGLTPFKNYQVTVECSGLGNKAGVLGAAALFNK